MFFDFFNVLRNLKEELDRYFLENDIMLYLI